MNQSLERIIFIGLNLTLIISIGLPLLLSTTHVITETEQQLIYQQFINDVDETILFADQNQISVIRKINVPKNLTMETQLNQLIFQFFSGDWYVIHRSYRCMIILDAPSVNGPHLIQVNATTDTIHVSFQLP